MDELDASKQEFRRIFEESQVKDGQLGKLGQESRLLYEESTRKDDELARTRD